MDVLVVLGTTSAFLYSILSVASACLAGGEAKHFFFETSGVLLLTTVTDM
jgi:cation transport ATPase